jgi:hypothetical protein
VSPLTGISRLLQQQPHLRPPSTEAAMLRQHPSGRLLVGCVLAAWRQLVQQRREMTHVQSLLAWHHIQHVQAGAWNKWRAAVEVQCPQHRLMRAVYQSRRHSTLRRVSCFHTMATEMIEMPVFVLTSAAWLVHLWHIEKLRLTVGWLHDHLFVLCRWCGTGGHGRQQSARSGASCGMCRQPSAAANVSASGELCGSTQQNAVLVANASGRRSSTSGGGLQAELLIRACNLLAVYEVVGSAGTFVLQDQYSG